MFEAIFSPIYTIKQRYLRAKYARGMVTVFNIHSESEAQTVITSAHDYIAHILEENNFLLPEGQNEVKLNFPAVIVYAYLKEGLVLLPDAAAVVRLNNGEKYKAVRDFIRKFEETLENCSFTASFIPLTTRELNAIAERHAEKSRIESPYKEPTTTPNLSLIHICRCRRLLTCRSRWSP
eukprot:TRINITY_DN11913_c0_g1_i3.p2 TRINITY_DN11913_c0_g1~~TRINITY_DN11913_c0_g1_i3.p2  ORF type:complete len:179 (+),score=51.75 TRINITY_DN11913_c0_g1_i3:553-1089(+)